MTQKEKLKHIIYRNIKELKTNKLEVLSLGQNARSWFIKHHLQPLYNNLQLKKYNSAAEIRTRIMKYFLGNHYCVICKSEINKTYSWNKPFPKTCCNQKCKNKQRSLLQQGDNNTASHKRNKVNRKIASKKQSITMKRKIQNGEFTPQINNYFTHKMLRFKLPNGEIKKCRSSWEVVYWLIHPTLQYEKIRIEYYDTHLKKTRIYIVDFYDEENQVLIELKPKKYHKQNSDKLLAAKKYCKKHNLKWVLLDDSFFTKTLLESINLNRIIDKKEFQKRVQWYKNENCIHNKIKRTI